MGNTQTNAQENSKIAIMATGSELKSLRECTKSYYYRKLKLNTDSSERLGFLKTAVVQAACILKEQVLDYNQKIEEFFRESYQRKWYDSAAEFEDGYNKDLYKIQRMADYIVQQGYAIHGVQQGYDAKFNNRPLSFKGYDVLGLRGVFDLVLEKEGHLTLVTVFCGKPAYAMRARKEGRKPENSLELLVSQLGGYMVYKQPFTTQLWYLGNSDDSGKNMPAFEHRKGKSIISADFSKKTSEEVFKHFLNVLLQKKEHSCEDCNYCNVCKKPALRLDTVKETTKKEEVPNKEKSFTKSQLEVIEHVNGPMCCIAVPGAGKTTALVQRLVRLVQKGAKPERILMLTFTKKAQKEMEDRVRSILGPLKSLPVISTYNALGFSILKENPIYLGGKRVKLADDVDRYTMIYNALQASPIIKGMSYTYISGEHGLIRELDGMFIEITQKGREFFVNHYGERKDVEGILKVYDVYSKEYKEKGYISYDDQIMLVNQLFESYKELLNRYQERYEYVMVDEFQDTSEEQAAMIYTLVRKHLNLVVVGDDDQSIYTWRGGSPEFMLHFQRDFPEAKMVYMEDNFRSTAGILNLASNLITGNGMRYEKTLTAHIDGKNVPYYVKGTPAGTLDLVDACIKKGIQPGDICILARNNRLLREVQTMLECKYPVAVPKDYLIEDAGFLAILDVLTLYYNGMDEDCAFYRLMYYLGAEDCLVRKQGHESLFEAMKREEKLFPVELTAECMEKYYSIAKESKGKEAVYRILKCFEYISYGNVRDISKIMQEIFGINTHRVLDALWDLAEDRGIIRIKDLYALMCEMVKFKVTARVGYDVSKDSINLLTCHDSKGKEFPLVIIYGVEEFDESEESIRLLYVAVTRAKKQLYLMENSTAINDMVFNKLNSYVKVVKG